ncbi:Exocyst complex component 2 [Paramuricea clavata]|uniref:Exocyst complex component 2 n=1 Tax=Paramuricea clavata TaxID=317549 RepID=A0A7D9DM93_PARCT|nr:Exocyst complex component 2 [Paramuricea clavata]
MHAVRVEKEGVCQASVIFGVGKEKYRTDVVKGDNPTWNEEGVINVSNPNASLVLTVMDREDTIGNITLPVINLPSAAHKRRWLPLQRKHQQTSSDLCFDCWITQFKKETVWNKFNPFFSSAPSPQEKRRESIASASTGIRGSTSTLELCSKSLEQDRRDSVPYDSKSRRLSSGKTTSSTDLSAPVPPRTPSIVPQESSMPRPKLLPTLGAVMSMKGPPEITGISPRFGPSRGGTKITIRGCNLGTNTGDFLGFTICSVDHLDSLEYHTPAKLVCTTQPWGGKKPNPGPIVLVTKSGGRGVSTIKFEFQGDPVVPKKKNSLAKGKGESNKKETKNTKNETSIDVEKLRRNVQDLTSENQSLRSYIDKLMLVLMEKYPDALEATMSIDSEK